MSLPHTAPDAPDFVHRFVNLADARLGAEALEASDDFFADKARMLNPRPAVFVPGKYDEHGKWMDGWESRRRRGPGHDWCIVKLARPGSIQGLDLDTSHFTGNFPPAASVEACLIEEDVPELQQAFWRPLLPAVNLGGNRHHYFPLDGSVKASHLRVNLFPDGGLARLRVYGMPEFDAHAARAGGFDLVAALHGGTVVAANNEHFGRAANLLLPGRGVDMGDGWETRRRREPGNDWCILRLAHAGVIEEIDVDTCHFKGNYPDRCSIQAAHVEGGTPDSLVTQSMFWPELLPEQKLRMDAQHLFKSEIRPHQPVSHVRFNLFPDGGVSRLRLYGRIA
ncbi:MAG: allantoicase [Xanthomonadales bacterium]|nr:allantoicase [Xanthomonadales bacterium]